MMDIQLSTIDGVIKEKLTHGGIFLCAGSGDRSNVLTIGWGGRNHFWGKEIFIAPIRHSRYTYPLITESGVFTVSIPLHDMKRELAYAGTKSGRDEKKFVGHGLTPQRAQDVDTVIVKECELHLECRVLASTELMKDTMDESIYERNYSDNDMHTLFMGEILRCYTL